MVDYREKRLKYKLRYQNKVNQVAGARTDDNQSQKINTIETCLADVFLDMENNYGCYNLILSIGHDLKLQSFLERDDTSSFHQIEETIYQKIAKGFTCDNHPVILYFAIEFNIPRKFGFPTLDENSRASPPKISYYKKVAKHFISYPPDQGDNSIDVPIYVIPLRLPKIHTEPYINITSKEEIMIGMIDESRKRNNIYNRDVSQVQRLTRDDLRRLPKITVDDFDNDISFLMEKDGQVYEKKIEKKNLEVLISYFRLLPFMSLLLSKSIYLLEHGCCIHIKNNYYFNDNVPMLWDRPSDSVFYIRQNGNVYFSHIPYLQLYIFYLYKLYPRQLTVTKGNSLVPYTKDLVERIYQITYPNISNRLYLGSDDIRHRQEINHLLHLDPNGKCHRDDIGIQETDVTDDSEIIL